MFEVTKWRVKINTSSNFKLWEELTDLNSGWFSFPDSVFEKWIEVLIVVKYSKNMSSCCNSVLNEKTLWLQSKKPQRKLKNRAQ